MDRGSKRRAGATVNGPVGSFPAMEAPGSCVPGAPILWDTRPLMGVFRWDHTGPMTSELQRAKLYENSAQFDRIDAKRKTLKCQF